MRQLALLILFTCAFCRILIPMNDQTEQLLRENGLEPDSNWYQVTHTDEDGAEPVEFDMREKWPHCTHVIRDEGKCGASWAITAASVLSDLNCIESKEKVNVELSPQYLVSCDKAEGGCKPKYTPKNIFQFMNITGIPSEECDPWTSWQEGIEGQCPEKTCKGSAQFTPYFCNKVIFAVSETDIKQELLKYGPMFCKFDRYSDFDDYKSGIYYKVASDILERDRAAKVVGWGLENGIHFWIFANSWGTKWGENGYFRMKIGEAGICNIAVGCDQVFTTSK